MKLIHGLGGSILLISTFAAYAPARGNANQAARSDTVFVTAKAQGKWGPPHDAVEVLRVPVSREATFGSVLRLQATPTGGVLVVDEKSLDGVIVREFDANGRFVRNIGRSGNRPGDYNRNVSLAVHPNGTIYVRDGPRSVSLFRPNGQLINTFPLFHNNGSTTEIVPASDGTLFVDAPFPREGVTSTAQRPLLHYDAGGRLLDSLFATAHWLAPETKGPQRWKRLPDGRHAYMRPDRLAVLVLDSAKKQPPVVWQAPQVAVPYLPEERKERQAAYDLYRERCNPRGERTVIPAEKPIVYDLSVDVDGRVWVLKATIGKKGSARPGPSCYGSGGGVSTYLTYQDPPAFVGFLADGSYLGEVRFPVGSRVTFVGKTAWALVPDTDEVHRLIKYRLY